MAAVTSASDLLLAAPSKRSRGLADIDPKFVSNVIHFFVFKELNLSPFSFLFEILASPSLHDANRVMGTRLLYFHYS